MPPAGPGPHNGAGRAEDDGARRGAQTREEGGSRSPPQVVGSRSTPTSFAPGPGRETPLLNAEMLQRMQALEHRAPLFYPSQPVVSDRPQSGTDSTSIPQEVIQAEVARQLAVLDQRATARELEIAAQELEIQRLRQQIAEANAHREQALRAAALSSAQSTARVPAQPPQVAMQSQLSQASVPNMSQVQGVASQAVDANRSVAPAIQATSFRGLVCVGPTGMPALLHPEGLELCKRIFPRRCHRCKVHRRPRHHPEGLVPMHRCHTCRPQVRRCRQPQLQEEQLTVQRKACLRFHRRQVCKEAQFQEERFPRCPGNSWPCFR